MIVNGERSAGLAAALCSIYIVWFALWTIFTNAAVLFGSRYPTLIWCFVGATLITMAYVAFGVRRISELYRARTDEQAVDAGLRARPVAALGMGAATLASAILIQNVHVVLLVVLMMTIVSIIAYKFYPVPVSEKDTTDHVWLSFIAIYALLSCLYFFGHWSDADDANYINLAIGAQRTHGLIYQFDTMLGDGPGPLHLPTYRFQSYELLGAVISTLTGSQVIAVVHLVMPAIELLFFALLLMAILRPLVGSRWATAAIFVIAFLYGAISGSFFSWGATGLVRFFQGKAFLVTALVPLAATLTVRWFLLRQKIDLLGLALCHVCAIGFSANGLFITPLACAAAAIAMILSQPSTLVDSVRTAAWLLPTLFYPALMGAVGLEQHLFLPSELIGPQPIYESFRHATGRLLGGAFALAILPLAALPFRLPRLRLAAAIYVPLFLALALNPLGWKLASALSGNLPFRVFWSIPAAFIAGLAMNALSWHLFAGRAWLQLAAALSTLAMGLVYNQFMYWPAPIVWATPRLHVVQLDYQEAERVAVLAPKSCVAMVPENVAVWLVTIPDAPYPAFVRSLYLDHYRFSMPPAQLAMRRRLLEIEEGKTKVLPTTSDLASAGIAIGLIAARPNGPAAVTAAHLAAVLGLREHGTVDRNLTYWRGTCRVPNDSIRPRH